jgi:hypothetical protein
MPPTGMYCLVGHLQVLQPDDDVDDDPGEDDNGVGREHRPHAREKLASDSDGSAFAGAQRTSAYTIAAAITAKKRTARAAAVAFALVGTWLLRPLATARLYAAARSASTSSSFDMSARPLMSARLARS